MGESQNNNPTDFVPDRGNANQGTQHGQKMIQESLQEDGVGRGVVVDELFSSFYISTYLGAAYLFSTPWSVFFLAYRANLFCLFDNVSSKAFSRAINTIVVRSCENLATSWAFFVWNRLQRFAITLVATKLSPIYEGIE